MNSNKKITFTTRKITTQEESTSEYNVDSHKQQCEHKRETELTELLSQEKARNRIQQLEIERRHHQLEESTQLIRKLQNDLDQARKTARRTDEDFEQRKDISKTNDLDQSQKNVRNAVEDFERRNDISKEPKDLDQARNNIKNEGEDFERRKDMTKTIMQLDEQCEKLTAKLRDMDSERKTLQSENVVLKKKIEELQKPFFDKFKMEMDNKLLKQRITQLERDLKEINERGHKKTVEPEKIQPKLKKSPVKQNESQMLATRSAIEQLQNENKNLTTQISELKKRDGSQMLAARSEMEQLQNENKNLTTQISELKKRELDIINENTLLRQNFSECLKKAENFRDQIEQLTQTNTQLKFDLQACKETMTTLEDQVFELRMEIEQKDKLVAYLQSTVQPKQMQKLPKPRPSLLSSEADFLSDIESEYKKCQQLEQHRNLLKIDLEQKRKVLAEKQNGNESVPLLKDQQSSLQSNSDLKNSPMHSSTESSTITTRTPGKMRHDIPHRWKRQFITVTRNRCQVCMECLPYFHHIFRCRDCAMAVHQHCRQVVVNTCGLPTECADFYLDTYSTSTEDATMTGWIKLLICPNANRPLEKWRNAWASIEEHKLSFYESDQLALGSCGTPFVSIDLDTEHWRIYNQTADKPVNGVSGEDMSMLIELRMPSCTLFMLVPTTQAKLRWVHALQYATNRRIFIQRKPSSMMVSNSLLLALEAPQNLTINCTQILRDEWLLIGADEGLFATSIQQQQQQQQQLRAPFHIGGISKVYSMEFLPEFDMLLTICGFNRQLMVIHLQQLYRAFKADQQPSINLTSVSNVQQCHIMVVSKPEHVYEKRFVYLATIDSIIILQYITKLGIFSPINEFKTEEPCMCICSTPNGFIFGADNFHFVKFENNFSTKSQLMVDNCPFDIPVAVVNISDNEYLLAFHNFGLFVNSQGERTRSSNVEWDKVPLEFVYKTPYLYIVYCEFLEVIRLAPQIGLESGTLTDDRSIFKCQSAHCTGFGLSPSEVLFVVSSENIVELHSFGQLEENSTKEIRSVQKRKINDQTKQSGTKKKH